MLIGALDLLWEVIAQKVHPSLPNDVKKWLLKKPSKDMKKNQSKTDVKSLLGGKVIPVKERLGEKVEFKTPTMPRKKSSTKDKGKRKADTSEKKAWVEKKHGVLAKGETTYSKIECRSSKGCLLAKVMDEEEEADKNWKRARKEKKD